MFVGDQGTGFGSRIKGFPRYGGGWRPQIHGGYSTVYVTNEYNTSQTCVFCFEKLLNLSKVMTKEDG